jgi:predicted nucleotidyltransferase
MENKYTLDYITNNNLILLEVIGGSHAYGTNIETSDEDRRGVYVAELDDILSGNYPEQINDKTNDIVFYELSRFLQLVKTNNPNILELLNSPEDCIIYKHNLFDNIIEHRNEFITKICGKSFGGYGVAQIKKAKGLDKKQNWEKDKVTRKDVLDFCYVIEGDISIPFKLWNSNEERQFDVKFCGVSNVPNARDIYSLYYDGFAYNMFSENIDKLDRDNLKKHFKQSGKPMGFGYKGIVKTGEGLNVAESNQLRLSSIPKGEKPICIISYNKDAYTQHCKDYLSYQEWLENRNEARYVDNKNHGQKYDSKNMMHCIRLIRMAKEIANGEGIKVRRLDRDYLLSIRRGEVDLETLIKEAEESIIEMDNIFDESNLPNKVNPELVNNLLVKIRKEFYGIS